MTSEQLFYDKKTGFDRLTEADRQGIQIGRASCRERV